MHLSLAFAFPNSLQPINLGCGHRPLYTEFIVLGDTGVINYLISTRTTVTLSLPPA